jgi:parallel beta-helix repeat protein
MKSCPRIGRFLPPLLILTLLLACGGARAQSNLVLLVSQPGDWIGGGGTYVTTNPANFTVSGGLSMVGISAFGFWIQFSPPYGSPLVVGKYTNDPSSVSAPFAAVSGNGRGCSRYCGSWEIMEIHTNTAGSVDRFWATLTQSCECGLPPMSGEIRISSQLAPPAPGGRTLRVPFDYATIQAGLDAASALTVDTVLVNGGTYNEVISFRGKDVRLVSASGPAFTTIRGPMLADVVSFSGSESPAALISGFTIISTVAPYSSGIAVGGASPTIVGNVISGCANGITAGASSAIVRGNNVVNSIGTGIGFGGAGSAVIEGNTVQDNQTGIALSNAQTPIVRNNFVAGNRADGVNVAGYSDADIIQNVIVSNTGNGIYWQVPAGRRGPRVLNNTIFANVGSGIYADGYGTNALIMNNIVMGTPALTLGSTGTTNPPVIQYNDFYSRTGAVYSGLATNITGVAGNLSTNPLFTCEPSGDLHLLAPSPCVDAGTNDSLLSADFDGNARVLDGNTNGVAVVDLGAYEFNPAVAPVPCLYMTCPTNMTVTGLPGQTEVVVNYLPPVAAPVATLTMLPPSGSPFPGGTNQVGCTAAYGTNSVSCGFTIVVNLWPTITAQPQNTNVSAGQTFSLTVGAIGSAPLGYTWSFEGGAIAGATNSSLTITNAQAVNEGVYRVSIANFVGSVTSRLAAVRVLPAPPAIGTGPSALTVAAGSNVVFSVAAAGSQPMWFTWLKGGALVAAGASPQLVISNAQPSNAGSYQVVLSNALGVVTSDAVMLTVLDSPPAFVLQPLDKTVTSGTNVVLSALARGSDPVGYQWRKSGASLAGATQTTLILSNASAAASGSYDVVASNVFGTATSAVAQVTVNQKPTLLQGLSNQIVDVGGTVVLAVDVIGSGVLSCAWQFNGLPLAATNAFLALTNIQMPQAGYYRVTITNQLGTVSSTGRVSVFNPPSAVVAWGDNSGGQTNVPAGLNDAAAVAGGDFHTLALRHNGTLLAWGYNGDGQANVPTGSARFVGIAAGAGHNLALTENGNVTAWGRNDSGQTSVPAAATNVLTVAAGDAHSLALLASGTVLAWGNNAFGQGTNLSGLTGVRAIAAGRNHNLALRTNGTVTGWGYNGAGQASPPATLTNASAIAAGYLHSAALLSNGTVVVWGDNSFGQANVPATVSNVVAIAAGDFHSLALRADGVIIGWGDDSYGQLDAPVLPGPAAIASGNYHGLALIPTPVLQFALQGNNLVLQWKVPSGLLWAPTPLGPFSLVLSSGQSYTNDVRQSPAGFFRLRR